MQTCIKLISILSFLLLILLGYSSYQGVFNPMTFSKDAISMGTQGIGQDFVNLFVVMPLFLVALLLYRRESVIGGYLFGGTLFYILYSYFIYTFGVNFNHLFLVYCSILGLSFYTFIIFLVDFEKKVNPMQMNSKPLAIFLIFIGTLFYLLWLKDVVPALLTSSVPKTISDNHLLTNPVHVLDLSIALPGLIISAILLLKKHKMGFVLAPVLLVFLIILTIALIGMVVALKVKNVSEDISLMYIFGVITLISVGFLSNYFMKLKK